MKSISKISLRSFSTESTAKWNLKINPERIYLEKKVLAKSLNIFKKNYKRYFSKSVKPITLSSVLFNFLITMLLISHTQKGLQPNFIC